MPPRLHTPAPFAPIPHLFLEPADSDLADFLRQAHELLVKNPALLDAADADLDAHGLGKKKLRLADALWHENKKNKTAPLPGLLLPARTPAPLQLLHGRPRTPAYVVLTTVLLRGYFGSGFKACDADSLLQESVTLRVFFENLGLRLPGRSTLTELVNAISLQTRRLLLDAQVALALELELDDFLSMFQDSTHVAANSEWPTDSRLIISFSGRLLRVSAKLDRFLLPCFSHAPTQRLLERIVKLNRQIEFAAGKKDSKRRRTRRYRQLLAKALLLHQRLDQFSAPLPALVSSLDVPPSQQERIRRVVDALRADVASLHKAINACNARVLNEQKVAVENKVLSSSDQDAAFIKKGQRDPVIGYKPQLALSEQGFLTGFHLPLGNAADSKQLLPMLESVTARTKLVPFLVSVDDGYASKENMRRAKAMGVTHVVIGGAKGRKLTSDEDWVDPLQVNARGMRSKAESLMFTVKQGYNFGELARRGGPAVRAELLEKLLAYNICRLVSVRRAREQKALDQELAQAA
jgi:Transposase DDE domain